MASLVLIAILIVVPGFQAVLAQESGEETDRITEELKEIRNAIKSSGQSSDNAFWMAFWCSMGIAGIAIVATFLYIKKLNRQVTNSEKQLELTKKSTDSMLRPIISWTKYEDEDMYKPSSDYDGDQLLIRLTNVGRGAALDIKWRCKAGIVGAGDYMDDSNMTYHLVGSLAPNASSVVPVVLTTSELSEKYDGRTLQIFATAAYKSADNKEYRYFLCGSRVRGRLVLAGTDGEDPALDKRPYGISGDKRPVES